ncbi:unnamed protein product [Echinostoma caproni]|uniref:Uncharacterized protein n=1 Tax=Echinostoma caproni TaxID=27848 RepID=A0A183AXF7_9TREM|nr:unnamed protein product [Echinostoma caproni]
MSTTPATSTSGTASGGTSTMIGRTFHVSHSLPHGASFQTHGSVLPVLPTQTPTREAPVEPIGVVAAGEADYSLDECEDRMLKSLPSPLFDPIKVNRSPPNSPTDPSATNAYSLGIKSTLITPVTPTSPSSLTSFGAVTQSPPARFDRSPVGESPSVVSNALAKCVKDREVKNETKISAEVEANREFCTGALTKLTKVESETASPSPIAQTTATVVSPQNKVQHEVISNVVAPLGGSVTVSATPSSPVKISTSETTTHTSSCTIQSAAIQPTTSAPAHTETLRSFTTESTTVAASQNDIVIKTVQTDHASPDQEASSISQLQTFSSTVVSTSKSEAEQHPVESATFVSSFTSEQKHISLVSIPSHASVTTFVQPNISSTVENAIVETSKPDVALTASHNLATTTISPSTSFQSRLRAPMVSVARPSAPSETDTWSRTPEFPAPYRPVSNYSGLQSPKVAASETMSTAQAASKENNHHELTRVSWR